MNHNLNTEYCLAVSAATRWPLFQLKELCTAPLCTDVHDHYEIHNHTVLLLMFVQWAWVLSFNLSLYA